MMGLKDLMAGNRAQMPRSGESWALAASCFPPYWLSWGSVISPNTVHLSSTVPPAAANPHVMLSPSASLRVNSVKNLLVNQ